MVERIAEIIKDNGIMATPIQVNKNGIILDGISLGDGTVKPTLYIKDFKGTNTQIAMATDIVGRVADKLNTDVYIIPSSIHECIITPATMAINDVTEMIMAVNDSNVDPVEQLSNHTYIYKRNIGEVECV